MQSIVARSTNGARACSRLAGVAILVGALAAQSQELRQQIIVRYVNDEDVAAASSERTSDTAARYDVAFEEQRTLAVGARVLALDSNLPREQLGRLINEIESDAGVEYAEEDVWLQPLFTPDDTLYNQQWDYYESTAGINVPDAWDEATGAGVNVAVLDTGYLAHADVSANFTGGYDFISHATNANDGNGRDSSALDPGDWRNATDCASAGARDSTWHGTGVAGIIGAVTDNSSGMPANSYPARVINMSLAASGSCSSTLQDAITASQHDAVIVVPAGNDDANASNTYPANCDYVLSVAAIDRDGDKASYSNYGSVVDIAAPGGESSDGILTSSDSGTTSPNGSDTFAYINGTSFAASHVAGVAALLFELDSEFLGRAVDAILRGTARSFTGTCTQCGSGIVDAEAAVDAVVSPTWTQVTNSDGSFTTAAASVYQDQSVCEWYPVFFCMYRIAQDYGDEFPIWWANYTCSGTTVYPASGENNGYRRTTGCIIEAMEPLFGN